MSIWGYIGLYSIGFRWTPHPVIVVSGIMRIISGSSYIPVMSLLQGRGPPDG